MDGEYWDYLQSDHWKETSKRAKDYYRHRCGVCGMDYRKRNFRLDTHHLVYTVDGFSILGRERMRDFRLLCEWHHPRGIYPLWKIRRRRLLYLAWKCSKRILMIPVLLVRWLFTGRGRSPPGKRTWRR